MKKIKMMFIVMLSLAMIVAMCGCSNGGGTNSQLVENNTTSSGFISIYNELGLSENYAAVASDGSYLKIFAQSGNLLEATEAWENINEKLGLPLSLREKIVHTNALDGNQSESFGNVKVTWSYSNSNGLLILYEYI